MPKVTVKLQDAAPSKSAGGEGDAPKAKKGLKATDVLLVPVAQVGRDVSVVVGRPETPRKYSLEHVERIITTIALACITSGATVRFDLDIDLPGLQNPRLRTAVLRCMKAAKKPPKSCY